MDSSSLIALALACAPAVEVGTVQALVRNESGSNPYALGVGRAATLSHQPRTKDQALHAAAVLTQNNIEFDVGLAQIRTTNLRRFGITVESALDPCINLQLMQRILLSDYGRAVANGYQPIPATLAALSAYNTGSFKNGLSNGYVNKVIASHPTNRRQR